MKKIYDIVQILLSNLYGCTLLAIICFQLVKVGFVFISDLSKFGALTLRRYFIAPTFWNGFKLVFISVALTLLRVPISDYIQNIEQTEINPIYAFEYTPDESQAVRIFESEIQKGIGTEHFNVLKKYVLAVSDSLGCTPLTVYQIALSECALNPFIIRSDGVAAGWMQLTSSGCTGLIIDGKPLTMPTVKQACKNRDIDFIMRSCNLYLTDRAKGKRIEGMKDFYMLVFAPAFVGAADETVLYQGYNNPSYYLNSGFDGYYLDSNGRICQLNKRKDGKITVGEVYLHVKKKYIQFIKKHQ